LYNLEEINSIGPFLKKDVARGNTTISHHGIQKELEKKINSETGLSSHKTHTHLIKKSKSKKE
jgi:hypothetical protein